MKCFFFCFILPMSMFIKHQENTMPNLNEMLPFLIPIIIVELSLTVAALVHILTHKTYKSGNRTLWIVLSFIQIIGPILYFIFGKSDE